MDSIKYTPLSFDELIALSQKHYGKPVRVVNYQEMIKQNMDIHQLFAGHNSIVLYYPNLQTNEGLMGHYVALVKNDDNRTIYFMDSYGKKPDVGQKPKDDPQDLYDERQNTLIKLLLESGYNVDYSPYKFQSIADKNIATCGRHALMRSNHPELNTEEYHNLMKSLKDKFNMPYDDIVSYLVH